MADGKQRSTVDEVDDDPNFIDSDYDVCDDDDILFDYNVSEGIELGMCSTLHNEVSVDSDSSLNASSEELEIGSGSDSEENIGYNEAVSNIIPAQIDSNFLHIPNGNLYDSSFCMDLDAQNQRSRFGEIVSIYSQSSVDYTSGPQLTMPIERLDCLPFVEKIHSTSMPIFDNNNNFQPPVSLGSALPVKQSENELLPTQNTRKRSVEATDKKFKKAMFFQEDMEGEKIIRRRVPTRRSQKLTDKITALQKLVSPYGKTDTASVLLEAYISINVLQDQIQNLLHTHGAEKGVNLQRRGLCLVPVSFTRKLMEDYNLY